MLFPLRSYQEEIVRAILDSVLNGRGLSFSVQLPRQSGKNETSSRAEMKLLAYYAATRPGRWGVKAAPVARQANISLHRLEDRFGDAGLADLVQLEDGYKLRCGTGGVAFLSAEPTADNAGETAGLMLEADEAQDIDSEEWGKTFTPMAASTAATRVYWGTPWDDFSLLEQAKQSHLALQRRDGIRRHFEVDWTVVAEQDPTGAYGRYVEGERDRLGEDHPLFMTQYRMITIPGQGRLFKAADRALLQGTHPLLDGPVAGETYVAGVDVGGSGEFGASGEHDLTVLTLARAYQLVGVGDEPRLAADLVRHYAWQGAAMAELYSAVLQVLRAWRVRRAVVDATGVGEPLAAYLVRALGETRVEALKFTRPSKSALGYGLMDAVRRGACRVYDAAPVDVPGLAAFWEEIREARVEYLPGRLMRFYVDESEGHDDYLVSLALCVKALEGGEPRIARGRVA